MLDSKNLIKLLTIDSLVQGETGKVYSTAPEVALGADGKTYYIKGKNSPIAFSEVAGCRLAQLVGLQAPNANVGEFNGDLYAAIEEVLKAERNILPWLKSPDRIENQSHLFEVIAIDTWLVNDDRNLGNIVGTPTGDGRIKVFMIDFEKSRTLGENPFISSSSVDPKHLRPTAQLGTLLYPIRPPKFPSSVINRIAAISREEIQNAIFPVAEELPFVNWGDSSAELLHKRAGNIVTLVEEVWSAWKTN